MPIAKLYPAVAFERGQQKAAILLLKVEELLREMRAPDTEDSLRDWEIVGRIHGVNHRLTELVAFLEAGGRKVDDNDLA
jgi:hypothetical protein